MNEANAVHVMPIPDDPKHRLDGWCWCQPEVEVEIGGVIYIHRRTLDSPHRESDTRKRDAGNRHPGRLASNPQAPRLLAVTPHGATGCSRTIVRTFRHHGPCARRRYSPRRDRSIA